MRPATTETETRGKRPRLVVITPARNEAHLLGRTIRAVLSQTFRPVRWVIVSDGSTDDTERVVQEFAQRHDWIELLRLPEHPGRDFEAKARAFNAGVAHLNDLSFDYIANIDADISFPADYIESILDRMESNRVLGLAGTNYLEFGDCARQAPRSRLWGNQLQVPGACQIFRRACLQDIAGFLPVPAGAIDSIAATSARMKGWRTAVFADRHFVHHRSCVRDRGMGDALFARFRFGQKAYLVGGHPVWELGRALYSIRRWPYGLGAIAFAAGFLCGVLRGDERPVSREFIAFHRAEQIARLKSYCRQLGSNLSAKRELAPRCGAVKKGRCRSPLPVDIAERNPTTRCSNS